MRKVVMLMLCVASVMACTSKLKKENEALREEIGERREALKEKQQRELADARLQLAITDSLLTIAQREHDELHDWVMAQATELNEQSPEAERLNQLRARQDSLKVEFEKQAHKVKFFLRKIENRENEE